MSGSSQLQFTVVFQTTAVSSVIRCVELLIDANRAAAARSAESPREARSKRKAAAARAGP